MSGRRFEDALTDARARDARDPLAPFRDRFYHRPGVIYLDGNSLGLLSRDAEAAVLNALDEWKNLAIDGWLSAERPWFEIGEELGALQAEVVGAKPSEVVVTGSTTGDIHAMVATFYQPTATRTKIVADALNFPSDLYALAGQVRLRGLDPAAHLVLVPSRDGRTIDEADLIDALTNDVALLMAPSVLYRSGQLLDIERLAQAAQARGIPIGVDCSHSAGVVPHRFHEWGVDWAVWGTYKYQNGGPGSPAAIFVHERHHGTMPALPGWWGSDKTRQFDMSIHFAPAANAGAWQIGTPPIVSAAALYGALAITREAGIERIRAKSAEQTDWLIGLVEEWLSEAPYGFKVGSPRESERRGGHIALEHPDGVPICKALKARGIIADFRPPNVIRVAPIPLVTTYEEVWKLVATVREIVSTGEVERFGRVRETVA